MTPGKSFELYYLILRFMYFAASGQISSDSIV